jgi:hypothetical protein
MTQALYAHTNNKTIKKKKEKKVDQERRQRLREKSQGCSSFKTFGIFGL